MVSGFWFLAYARSNGLPSVLPLDFLNIPSFKHFLLISQLFATNHFVLTRHGNFIDSCITPITFPRTINMLS